MSAITAIAGYLVDCCFAYLYFLTVSRTKEPFSFRRFLGLLCPLLTIFLYPVGALPYIFNFELKFVVRFFLYLGFFLLGRDVPLSLSAYFAAFATALYTIPQNIFLTPITMPIMKVEITYFAAPLSNALFCLAVMCGIKGVCYLMAYKTVPLWGIRFITRARVTVLTTIIAISLVLKELQNAITDSGMESLPAYSAFFILLQISLLVCLILFEQYQRKLNENIHFRMEKVTTEALMQNIQVRKEKDDEVRELRHDLRNHMLTLRHMLQNGKTMEAERYIDSFLGQLGEKEVHLQTGSPMLDALMSEKLSRASKEGVHVSVVMDFHQGEFIDDFDLCVIMGNALDNAIESCLNVEGQERFIDIKGGPVANNLLIRIQNSSNRNFLIADGLPVTTKRDRENHGYGLRSIRHSLQKYGGTLDMSTENGQFVLSMLIPLQE